MSAALRKDWSAEFGGGAAEGTGAAASGELVWSPAGGSNIAGKAA
jgi:hypothetical protein